MINVIKKTKPFSKNIELLLERNRWEANEIGLEPMRVHGVYHLDFSGLTLFWLNQAAKRFILLQSATKSFSTCKSYLNSLNRFMNYIECEKIILHPEKFERKIIVGFLQYLTTKNFSVLTRRITLSGIKMFHQALIVEGWSPCSSAPIIYNNDFPKENEIMPRYIPDFVLHQLNSNLHHLSDHMHRFIVILMETGRRVSEICTLPFECLEQDNQGDWYLQVCEYKMKKIRLIPISSRCVNAIRDQQRYLNDIGGSQCYLFPTRINRRKSKSPHLSARFVNRTLSNMSAKYNIKDINGKLWHFNSHQFRHTLGTRMINTGVPQIMVQHYLGHETSEMTSKYAHIHNETMKAAFIEYQDKLINIKGEPKNLDDMGGGQWLKINIISQSLPNGLCALPMTQQRCPHANACLTCANFRTSSKYLPQHKKQLQETYKIIEQATKNGWQRVVESNTEVAENLKSIICRLEVE